MQVQVFLFWSFIVLLSAGILHTIIIGVMDMLANRRELRAHRAHNARCEQILAETEAQYGPPPASMLPCETHRGMEPLVCPTCGYCDVCEGDGCRVCLYPR